MCILTTDSENEKENAILFDHDHYCIDAVTIDSIYEC